jgi:hypothetical protein
VGLHGRRGRQVGANDIPVPGISDRVGTLNLIGASVIDAGEGRLSIEGQEIRAAKAISAARSGATVTVALRPESIELGEGGGANRLKGTV